jgi:hypothetical protein
MRNFSYTVRDATGAVKRGSLEASDRAGALAELKRRGVVPLSVTEGTANTRTSEQGLKRFIIPGVIIALLGVLALAWSCSEASARKLAKDRSAEKGKNGTVSQTKKGTLAHKKISGQVSSVKNTALSGQTSSAIENPSAASTESRHSSSDSLTNGVNDAEGNHGTLRTQTEQVLRMVESIPAGTMVPPPPPINVSDYKIAKTNMIVIAETDSVELADRKEKIAWLKQDIAQFVKEGYKPDDVVKAIVDHKNELAKTRTECMAYINALYKAGQDEEAAKFMEEANGELGKLGVSPLAHPRSRRLLQQPQP